MKKKRKSKNKAKFSDEQIRMLESMFKNEARPELQMKQQMAAQLGLLPRQVAIWFQNKRARSKSKLLVQEYNLLKGRYEDLAPKVEALKKENQHLLDEMQKLRNLIRDQQGGSNDMVEQSGEPILEQFDNTYTNSVEEEDETNKIILKAKNDENHVQQYTDSIENGQYYERETNLLDFPEVASFNHLTPCESWCNLESSFESNFFFDQPSSRSQWWEH